MDTKNQAIFQIMCEISSPFIYIILRIRIGKIFHEFPIHIVGDLFFIEPTKKFSLDDHERK